ncbi:IclR family transcriptional regulator [Streptomyces montanus]|uniref:IclR family transcriptional regulator n=2 Tax=Streptomyces montanus TaxID=2580423 RepID=A0A5R9FXD7_9ACTN|nr:IclR family transcriptional regulator [Streptomyces montanus]
MMSATSADARDNGGAERQGIQSVEIAMRILRALEESGGPVGLSAIAQASGTQPSKAHRYLVSLGRVGLTQQNPSSGLYDFGPALRHLGAEALRRTNEVAVASDHAARLRDETGHSVNVGVWAETGPIIVNWAYGAHPLPITVRVGATLPLLSSSIGNVFLAHLPDTVTEPILRQALSVQQGRAWSRGKADKLKAEVLRRGYALSLGGVIPGVVSVAAPVFTATDPMPLAMSFVVPDRLATDETVENLSDRLIVATRAVSGELGYSV